MDEGVKLISEDEDSARFLLRKNNNDKENKISDRWRQEKKGKNRERDIRGIVGHQKSDSSFL